MLNAVAISWQFTDEVLDGLKNHDLVSTTIKIVLVSVIDVNPLNSTIFLLKTPLVETIKREWYIVDIVIPAWILQTIISIAKLA